MEIVFKFRFVTPLGEPKVYEVREFIDTQWDGDNGKLREQHFIDRAERMFIQELRDHNWLYGAYIHDRTIEKHMSNYPWMRTITEPRIYDDMEARR